MDILSKATIWSLFICFLELGRINFNIKKLNKYSLLSFKQKARFNTKREKILSLLDLYELLQTYEQKKLQLPIVLNILRTYNDELRSLLIHCDETTAKRIDHLTSSLLSEEHSVNL